ncbi:MAG: sulfurtransferase [Betaproteobacteria bacterium]
MKRVLLAVMLGIGVWFSAGTYAGAIVDTAFVADALKRGAIVWDVRGAEDYRKGHIPGAVSIGEIGAALRYEHNEDYLPTPQIEKILGAAGIDPAREIVVYGDKGSPFTYFGLFTVEYFGGKNGRIYHGGIDDWKAAGRELATEPTRLAPATLKLAPNAEVAALTEEVVSKLGSNVQIVDVRTPKEYSGEDIRAIRGGHVPGAVNIPYEQNWADPATPQKLARKEVANKDGMGLKSPEQLKALYARLDPHRETIVYCQSGVRASETAAVLKDLGFDKVKVYDSSWLGYANSLSAPVEDVSFFNVGLTSSRLAALQRRVEALEKALAEAKAAK